MTKKPHSIVWHKKKGRFISSSALKPHSALPLANDHESSPQTVLERKKAFLQDLSFKIKKVVEG